MYAATAALTAACARCVFPLSSTALAAFFSLPPPPPPPLRMASTAPVAAAAAAPAPAAGAGAAAAAAPVSKNQISPAVPEKNGLFHSFMVNACKFIVDVKYSPLKPLGRGAYGVVCSALDKVANRKVSQHEEQQHNATRDRTDFERPRNQQSRAWDSLITFLPWMLLVLFVSRRLPSRR